MKSKVYLKEIEWPDFGKADPVIFPSVEELENRLAGCRVKMAEQNLSHLIVYADREHFANMMYLVHFDPRFEEALLIIRKEGTPIILVGNECVGHLPVSPLYKAEKLRYERYQPFSLLDQPRNESRQLADIFREEGIMQDSKIGCIGWKYFTESEFTDSKERIEIPSFIVDILRNISGYKNVTNASDILMSAQDGMKTYCSPFEIAHFEFSNVMSSEGVKNVLQNFKTGITDFELAGAYNYTGYPLGCHMGMKSSGNHFFGLSSPVGGEIKEGDPCSTGISYWGSNIYRAGWVAKDENGLPESAKGYIDNFAAPYFYACTQWFEKMKIGTKGKVFRKLIDDLLPFDKFGVYLNPGHLTHYDEWISSPIYQDSEVEIRSGMYIQVDIIPRSPHYFSSRMEDGIIIADHDLQNALKTEYPETYKRCMARRKFMIEILGINLPEEVLPLSNIPALVPPYFLDYKKVLSLKP